ncbi:alpha-amylase family glycosyl hydrolase, partial [Salmonella enterica subsp. enterica serovar Muenster]|nr:alpha-amylase family glycosyl hydrolase [Salmonella enterica subsp. enterica serovar Muenster]
DVDTGDSDNRNGQALLDLQNSNVVGGNKTFNDAYATLVSDVGISHLYASPIFTATKASTHGYDVTDANEIEPSIGGREGFERL